MNVFAVNISPTISARQLCDQHVVKMPTESAQIMNDVLLSLGLEGVCEKFNPRHTIVIWAASDPANFLWLAIHGEALCEEYSLRFSKKTTNIPKKHKASELIDKAYQIYDDRFNISTGMTDPKNANLIYVGPEEFRVQPTSAGRIPNNTAVALSYRNFYCRKKSEFAKWRHTNPPDWYLKNM